ncbi:MAG: hypothetical protein ACI8UO_001051 [Verrucomicrobiales bacterium]|jgi:hypothetical protein
METDYLVITYTIYLVLSLLVTVWVARTLHKNGRVFLVECFNDNTELADSVNHLLVVGFYLVNIGFVTLYLKVGIEVLAARQVFEVVAAKIGVVLLVLGGMHFFNIYIFTRMRRRGLMRTFPPPITPTTTVDLTPATDPPTPPEPWTKAL